MSESYLWSGLGLVSPLGARVSGGLPFGVKGVSIDTRTLQPGDLFFAIKGDNSDGHDYIESALAKGAAACVVDEAYMRGAALSKDDVSGRPLYVVMDTLKALQGLGRAGRDRSHARIVAVTGSVGKTTTKELLRVALGDAGETHASAASYNNHWGVPLTLARMPTFARYGVFEIGMNHAGEITPLVEMVRPHVCVITRVAAVHLEHFSSLDAIAAAKAEIFSGVMKGGVAILNRDDAQFEFLSDTARASAIRFVLSFGESEGADARLLSIATDQNKTHVAAEILGQKVSYSIGAPGRHIAMNSLAALLATRALGADLQKACDALAKFAPPSGRGQREKLTIDAGDFTLIDESYNANPVSMRAALDLLGSSPGKRRIAVLGDMLELGRTAHELHAGLAEDIARNAIDLVFAAGPLMGALYDSLPEEQRGAYARNAAELEPLLLSALNNDDVVMVKGSNGSRMGLIVKTMREKFGSPQAISA